MKKLLKLNLLVAIFMAILTMKSYATTSKATVQYGDLQSDGSMDVTVTLHNDTSSNTGFRDSVAEDGWTFTDTMVMKKTYTGINTKPAFKYFSYTINDNSETISIATPFIMHVNDKYTFNKVYILQSSNTTVVKQTNSSELTALSAGSATITMQEGTYTDPVSYLWEVTVVGESTSDPINSNYTVTCEGNKFVILGLPSGKYGYFVDTSTNTSYESSIQTDDLIEDNGKYVSAGTTTNMMALNQDLYAHIIDKSDISNYHKIADVKITRPSFDNYNYFNSLSCASASGCQLLFDTPYYLKYRDVTRKIHFKLGKITDNSILVALNNGDSSAFGKLKDFAKNDSNALYNKTVEATEYYGYNTDSSIVSGRDLVDNGYYYLYGELDTEDGKYIPLESVTITKASVYPNNNYSWFMFFYGSNEFNFDGISDSTTLDNAENQDTPPILPATGEKILVFSLVGITAPVAVLLFKKNKNTQIK